MWVHLRNRLKVASSAVASARRRVSAKFGSASIFIWNGVGGFVLAFGSLDQIATEKLPVAEIIQGCPSGD